VVLLPERHDQVPHAVGLGGAPRGIGEEALSKGGVMAELVTQDAEGRRGVAEASSGFGGGQTFDQKRPERLILAVRGVGGLEKEVAVPLSFSIIQDLSLLYYNTILSLSRQRISVRMKKGAQDGPRGPRGPAGSDSLTATCGKAVG
jgi:hypothetical protein